MSLETISVTSLERPWMCAPSPMGWWQPRVAQQQQQQRRRRASSRQWILPAPRDRSQHASSAFFKTYSRGGRHPRTSTPSRPRVTSSRRGGEPARDEIDAARPSSTAAISATATAEAAPAVQGSDGGGDGGRRLGTGAGGVGGRVELPSAGDAAPVAPHDEVASIKRSSYETRKQRRAEAVRRRKNVSVLWCEC